LRFAAQSRVERPPFTSFRSRPLAAVVLRALAPGTPLQCLWAFVVASKRPRYAYPCRIWTRKGVLPRLRGSKKPAFRCSCPGPSIRRTRRRLSYGASRSLQIVVFRGRRPPGLHRETWSATWEDSADRSPRVVPRPCTRSDNPYIHAP